MEKEGEKLTIDYEALGRRVRESRLKKSLTQERLAESVSVSVQHISKIENGNTKLSLPMLLSLAETLGVSVDYLVCDNISACKDTLVSTELSEIFKDCSFEDTKKILKILRTVKSVIAN